MNITTVQIGKARLEKIREMYVSTLKPLLIGTIEFPRKANGTRIHHFGASKADTNPTKTTRIGKEIKAMVGHLPLALDNAVFVRYDESNLDFFRAMVIGAENTPYAHGCYIFDIFMSEYPATPPKVNLITTGGDTVRFNPNLYANGYVCLSLLGTWSGQKCEVWNARSNITQVLVSIQSLVMSDDIYGNEPGFLSASQTPEGKDMNEGYCNIVRWANVTYAMLEQIKKPPVAFERVVQVHFYLKKDIILNNVRLWVEQASSTRANYTGLVATHNPSLAAKFEKRSQYLQALAHRYKELIQTLEDLKVEVQPTLDFGERAEEEEVKQEQEQ